MARDDYKRQKNAKQHGGAIRHVVGLFASFLCGYLVANVVDLTSSIAWVNQHWVNYQLAEQGAQNVASTAEAVKQAEIPKPKFEFYTLLSKDNNAPVSANRNVVLPTQSTDASSSNVKTSSQESSVKVGELAMQQQPISQAGTQVGADAALNLPSTSESKATEAADLASTSPSRATVPVTESQPVVAVSKINTSKIVTKETYMIQVAAVTRRQDADRLKASLTLKGYSVMIITPTDAKISWYRVVIGPFHSRPEAEKAQLNVARSEHIQGVIRKIDV